MSERHSLLRRQLKRYLPDYFSGNASLDPAWEVFIEAVNAAYIQSDTDRKMLERSLEFSSAELNEVNSELRAIVQAFPDLIVRFDNQGRILAARQGQSRGTETAYELLPLEQNSRENSTDLSASFTEALERARNSHLPVSVEYTVTGESGDRFYEARILPFGKNETIAIVRDISERRNAEEEKAKLELQLRRAQKLEAIGRLAGGIAHDFNNMLFSILGYTQLTLKKLQPESQAAKNLQEVLIAGNRAKEIVEQILIFSRWRKKEKMPVRPQQIVNEVLNLLQPSLPSNVEIQKNLDQMSPVIFADPTQIHQMLLNLTTNALHAMQTNGGVLSISVSGITLHKTPGNIRNQLPSGEYVKITISDTGHGIPIELIERIFEPFFTTKDVGEGTGLGLSVVHGIIQDHGGGIGVTSRPGAGTTFEIFIPAGNLKEKNLTEAAAETEARGTGRVLVVDDERALALLLTEMLESLGYTVTTTTDPLHAWEIFKADPTGFDLIMTDQTMPGLRGLKLAEKIREARPDLPVILCTGFSETMTPEQALEEGCKACLIKPISIEDLSSEISRVLAEARKAL